MVIEDGERDNDAGQELTINGDRVSNRARIRTII